MKKIAIVAPPFTSIPPKGQGGTERIIEEKIKGFLKKGYKITLIGTGKYKSKKNVEFIPVFEKTIDKIKVDSYKSEASRKLRLEISYLARAMEEIKKREKEFYFVFIHARGGYSFLPLFSSLKIPFAIILHLPIFKELAELLSLYKEPNIITISNSQRKGFTDIKYLSTVYNGIDLKNFEFNKKPKDYFLFMGALGEHKNPKDAILASKKANVKLILAGGKKREPYFSKELKALIDNKNIKYVGEVFGKNQIDLFRNAKALLFPIKWEEPFGLVMIEAMACGTPVIAYSSGAVKEVIKDKKTGFIVKNADEMAKKIKEIEKIKREDCRERVEENFTTEIMIDGYEMVMKKARNK